jgi:hypothetical protein
MIIGYISPIYEASAALSNDSSGCRAGFSGIDRASARACRVNLVLDDRLTLSYDRKCIEQGRRSLSSADLGAPWCGALHDGYDRDAMVAPLVLALGIADDRGFFICIGFVRNCNGAFSGLVETRI